MRSQCDDVKAGMAVLDAQTEQVGQIQDVCDHTLVIQVQRQVTIPRDAIAEVRENTVVLDAPTADWLPAAVEELRPRGRRGQVCSACGAIEGDDTAARYVRRGQAWLCLDCWRSLSPTAVSQVVQAVALQGVPVS